MSDHDLIRRGDALALCDRYPYVEGVKDALQDLPAVTVGVRPLVWDAPVKFIGGNKLEHMTACRTYKVVEWPDGSGHVLWFGRAGKQIRIEADAAAIGVDALKAAAQADYAARTLAATYLKPIDNTNR
jgi:hypothetical protein